MGTDSKTGHTEREIGTGMPSIRWISVSRWRTACPAIAVSSATATWPRSWRAKRSVHTHPDDLLLVPAEESLRGLVRPGDTPGCVEAQDGVVGGDEESLEEPERRGQAGRRHRAATDGGGHGKHAPT